MNWNWNNGDSKKKELYVKNNEGSYFVLGF